MQARPRALVMGAGSIGCYLGGLLLAAGWQVDFVGRPRVLQALREQGLTLSGLGQASQHLPATALQQHLHQAGPPAGLQPDLTLLCVKSGATAETAALLQATLPAGSLVLSMQNGVGNTALAQALAPALDWRAGMVPFNVAELSPGQFHRGTAGVLRLQGRADEAALQALQKAWQGQGLSLQLLPTAAAMQAVQWGKLLLNLNNPVNALSGLPLRAELLQRGYRRCFAALQEEALELLAAAGIKPAPMTPLPPRYLPQVLRLPSPLFRLLAARMLKIDAHARSSMADDLHLGRPTEIDALCGELVRLADKLGRAAPLNRRMVALVQAWPERQGRSYAPGELLSALQA
ncbi:2-dehydropantoate 2-reductase [Paucibacter oligotrophus]|uniref:2-dehydropantoate 2-reductase n=1 Tax=Roseateles oligotrophus TaxID=1769250 RepID=A0A840L9H4_9BURK|nr:2-dehydropantoate 2-reductase [Roseateles oligotrophus]MBB4842027.1 2-dehydropantoate 2-reductase [Roseateles oligotrophus]